MRRVPIEQLRTGDRLRLSVSRRELTWLVPPEEIERRRSSVPVARPTAARGYRKLFLDTVTQADRGVDFDFLRSDKPPVRIPRC